MIDKIDTVNEESGEEMIGKVLVIGIESTPNPATCKFVLNQSVLDETFEFSSPEDSQISPLAQKLFGFPWVSKVFLGKDFITVTKQDWVEWDILAEPLSSLLQEHFDNDDKLISELVNPLITSHSDDSDDSKLDPVSLKIKNLINSEIQPIVAMDGGEISFHSFIDGKVYIHMRGSCSGCPSAAITLKEGIETRLKEFFPEITEVIALTKGI